MVDPFIKISPELQQIMTHVRGTMSITDRLDYYKHLYQRKQLHSWFTVHDEKALIDTIEFLTEKINDLNSDYEIRE